MAVVMIAHTLRRGGGTGECDAVQVCGGDRGGGGEREGGAGRRERRRGRGRIRRIN